MHRCRRALACLSLAALLTGCPGSDPSAVLDFLLQDVNPTSPTFTNQVSPRDYITYVTGFYFGSAT